jgi:hypothetical protein
MRYRALDATGDMTFGQGSANFLVNSPDAVAQSIVTRLKLLTGEWFLDVTSGTDYAGAVLGRGTQQTRDVEIKSRIVETEGVLSLDTYSSSLSSKRQFSVAGTVTTIYGAINLYTASDGTLSYNIGGVR